VVSGSPERANVLNRSQAFTAGNHEDATSVLETFLRSGVYDEIEEGHDWADDKDSP
jgi:hypothetical protein